MGEAFIRKNNRVAQENEIVVVKDGQFQTGFGYLMRKGNIVFYNNYFTLRVDSSDSATPSFSLSIEISQLENINVSKIRIKCRRSTLATIDREFIVDSFDIERRLTGSSYFLAGPSWETTDANLNCEVTDILIWGQWDINISDISLFVEEEL